MNARNLDEQAAVNAVVALMDSKRVRDDPDAAGGPRPAKAARHQPEPAFSAVADPALSASVETQENEQTQESLKPYPFFYYRDHSRDEDPDPLLPLTALGRVPNFPAKMHSILSRPELSDIVAWMPHGRSWRVLKPREFEIRVIPTYFEHAKFSSFIRQANGWGFRRMTQGPDRNSYYHPLFLRGVPHLCKQMKRPGVAEKKAADPEHEPDLHKISEMYPVPEKAPDDSILLKCTLEGGPKARMPIYAGVVAAPSVARSNGRSADAKVTPRDEMALNSFQQSILASETEVSTSQASSKNPASLPLISSIVKPAPFVIPAAASIPMATPMSTLSALVAARNLALHSQPPAMATAAYNNSQFAAGFAAATAFSQQHFSKLLSGHSTHKFGHL